MSSIPSLPGAQGQGPSLITQENENSISAQILNHLLQQLPSYECLSAWYKAPPGCCWPPEVATSALGNIKRWLAPRRVQHSQCSGQSHHPGNINSNLESSWKSNSAGAILNYCLHVTREDKSDDRMKIWWTT